MKLTGILALAFNLVGGLPGLITTVVTAATKGKANLTPEGLESAGERAFTLSEADHKKIVHTLGVKDPGVIAQSLENFREAGVKLGHAFAYLEEAAAHLPFSEETVLNEPGGTV